MVRCHPRRQVGTSVSDDTLGVSWHFKAGKEYNIAIGMSSPDPCSDPAMGRLYCHAGQALQQPRSHESLGSKRCLGHSRLLARSHPPSKPVIQRQHYSTSFRHRPVG